jgi:predicted NBD/HSP70 family sugar kinase
VVLSHVRDAGPRSRAKVADETGLNKATVSSLVLELVERGLLAEGEAERGAVGRPGQAIEIDGGGAFALGVEINVDYIAALAMDLRGHVIAERRVALDTSHMDPSPVLRELSKVVNKLLGGLGARRGRPIGLAIALPGLVESSTGILRDAPNLGWTKVPVVAELRTLLARDDFPILLDNEANVAALAEIAARTSSGVRHLLLLTGAAGVGAGIVAEGRLLRGGEGFAGEVGHMRVDPGGKRCGCGQRGCWETVVGLNALLARAANRNDAVRDPSLDVEQRLAEINRRAAAGNQRTLRAIAETGEWLSLGAGMLVNIFNPEVLVLGGYFAALGSLLADPLADDLAAYVFAPDAGGCRVERSSLGFSGAIRGGALQVLDAVFQDPTLVERAGPA